MNGLQGTNKCCRFKGVLFDLDGVLESEEGIVDGAVALLSDIRASETPFVIITNDIRDVAYERMGLLSEAGIQVDPKQWLTPYDVLRETLASLGCHSPHFFGARIPEKHGWLSSPPSRPDAIVLGDVRDAEDTFDLCSSLSAEGIPLLALQKNPRLLKNGQPVMDVGSYVKTWETRLGRRAVVIGKPGQAIYRAALRQLDCCAGQAVMISDSFHNDLGGALRAGIAGILVSQHSTPEDIAAAQGRCRIADDLTAVQSILFE